MSKIHGAASVACFIWLNKTGKTIFQSFDLSEF